MENLFFYLIIGILGGLVLLLSYKIFNNNKSNFKQFHEQQVNFQHKIALLKEHYTT
jgi:hypothetical protein